MVRCPSCDGISVADSSASTAEAIRQAVLERVRAGQSDEQIDAFLVSRYGPGILLRPPVSGVTAWVWILPPVAVAAAVVAFVTVLWRRRPRRPRDGVGRGPGPRRAGVGRAGRVGGPERRGGIVSRDAGRGTGTVDRAGLLDERTFLLASLEDLEREHDAGDVSEQDYRALRDRYTQRAAEVLRALDGGDTLDAVLTTARETAEPPGTTRPPRRRRRALAVAGVTLLLVALALVMVLRQSGSRLPGASATGSVTLSKAQKEHQTLLQAETLEASGDGAEALTLYQQVLALDPTQNEALAESGWLEFEAGVAAKNPSVLGAAQQVEQRAEREDAGAYTISTWDRCCSPRTSPPRPSPSTGCSSVTGPRPPPSRRPSPSSRGRSPTPASPCRRCPRAEPGGLSPAAIRSAGRAARPRPRGRRP